MEDGRYRTQEPLEILVFRACSDEKDVFRGEERVAAFCRIGKGGSADVDHVNFHWVDPEILYKVIAGVPGNSDDPAGAPGEKSLPFGGLPVRLSHFFKALVDHVVHGKHERFLPDVVQEIGIVICRVEYAEILFPDGRNLRPHVEMLHQYVLSRETAIGEEIPVSE